MPSPSEGLAVDRIACTGHGICASLLPEMVTLDEWGYPIIAAVPLEGVDPQMTELAVRMCPVRALFRTTRHTGAPQRASSSTGRAADF